MTFLIRDLLAIKLEGEVARCLKFFRDLRNLQSLKNTFTISTNPMVRRKRMISAKDENLVGLNLFLVLQEREKRIVSCDQKYKR
jgi:hypothetical protein